MIHFCRSHWLYTCVLLGFILGCTSAYGETDEERDKRCPEGQYSGEGSSRINYVDPYQWFVTKEFAKRFCMPDRFINPNLKGALAVAVMVKPKNFKICGYLSNIQDCKEQLQVVLEIYYDNKTVKLPKGDESVTYFAGVIHNSGWLLGTQGFKHQRRLAGENVDQVGEKRPFAPINKRQDEHTQFVYLGVRNDRATESGSFFENFYLENFVPGINMLSLDGYLFGFKGLRNPDLKIQTERREGRGYSDEEFDQKNPIKSWAIGVVAGKKFFDPKFDHKKYPGNYDHIIELPIEIPRIIYEFDWRTGEEYQNSVKQILKKFN